jgi:chromosome segregation ATPase
MSLLDFRGLGRRRAYMPDSVTPDSTLDVDLDNFSPAGPPVVASAGAVKGPAVIVASSDVEALKQQLATFQKQVAKLQADNASLTNTIRTAQDVVPAGQPMTGLQQAFAQARNTMTQLRAQLAAGGGSGGSAAAATLQKQIAKLQTDNASLTKTIQTAQAVVPAGQPMTGLQQAFAQARNTIATLRTQLAAALAHH